MNRRSFLRNGGMLLGGMLATQFTGRAAVLRTCRSDNDNFSIDLVTNRPAEASELLHPLLSAMAAGKRIVYREFPLRGEHTGDLVFIRQGRLIDYRDGAAGYADELAGIARRLELPATLLNPTLLRFAVGGGASATSAEIFQGPLLIGRVSLDEPRKTHRVEGSRGAITLSVSEGAVRIVDASCRHQTCLKMGAIRQAGESLVCIPNRIRITLAGSNETGIDGITH